MVNLFASLPTSLGEYTDILLVASGECIGILMVASETEIKGHHNHFWMIWMYACFTSDVQSPSEVRA